MESASPSRTTMLEDSSNLDGETPLTESGKARQVTYGWLLAMGSKRVCCSLFLPTTESDSYIQKAIDKERVNERENMLQRDRA